MKQIPIIITIVIFLVTSAIGYGQLLNRVSEAKENIVEVKIDVKDNAGSITELEKAVAVQTTQYANILTVLEKLEKKIP